MFHEGWWYWSRTHAGQQYPVHCRRPDPSRALDQRPKCWRRPGPPCPAPGWPVTARPRRPSRPRRRAGGGRPWHRPRSSSTRTSWPATDDYFALGVFDVRPDQEVLAYAVDHDGSERYTLRFRDLGSGDDLADVVDDVYYGSAWSAGGKSFYYVRPDKAMRPWQVWRHALGTRAPGTSLFPGGRRALLRLRRA